MAERFLYLPSVAMALVAGWAGAAALRRAGLNGWRDVSRAREPRALLAGGAVALFLLAGLALTQYRTEDWRDEEHLFTRMAAASPRSWKAANGLGHVYEDQGYLAAAAAEYRRAMTLNPSAAAPVVSLALVEGRMGLHTEAARHAEAARRLIPDAWRPIAEQAPSAVIGEAKP
jgi:tetratricopeptide (TPR) repeat protein